MRNEFLRPARSRWLAVGAVLSASTAAGVRADSEDEGFTLPMMSMSLIPPDDGDARTPSDGHAAPSTIGEVETGADPSKLLYRFEFNPQFTDLEGDGTPLTANIEFDFPITKSIGIDINPKGWWLQADYQPKIDWEGGGEASHLMEFEAGAMLTRRMGVSILPGIGFGENKERDWSIGVGLRFLF